MSALDELERLAKAATPGGLANPLYGASVMEISPERVLQLVAVARLLPELRRFVDAKAHTAAGDILIDRIDAALSALETTK